MQSTAYSVMLILTSGRRCSRMCLVVGSVKWAQRETRLMLVMKEVGSLSPPSYVVASSWLTMSGEVLRRPGVNGSAAV
jgi:hypothetical protein